MADQTPGAIQIMNFNTETEEETSALPTSEETIHATATLIRDAAYIAPVPARHRAPEKVPSAASTGRRKNATASKWINRRMRRGESLTSSSRRIP